MTLFQILDKCRDEVENIEDLVSSLDSYPDGEPTLERMLNNAINDLEKKTGFKWTL